MQKQDRFLVNLAFVSLHGEICALENVDCLSSSKQHFLRFDDEEQVCVALEEIGKKDD